MKMTKVFTLFCSILLSMITFVNRAASQTAYAVLQDSTLTFFYDSYMPEGALDVGTEITGGSSTQDWKLSVKKVVFNSSFKDYEPKSCNAWFYGCSNLIKIVGMKKYLNTSSVTSMHSMFNECRRLATLDVSGFKTDNVTDMEYMFKSCSNIKSLDLSSFNTAKVTDMSSMFEYCSSLTSLDLSSFDTEKVRWMSSMFTHCSLLRTIYVSDKWTTSGVSSIPFGMFGNCPRLTGGQGTLCRLIDDTGIKYAHIDGGQENPGFFTRSGDAAFVPNEAYAILRGSVLKMYYAQNPPEDAYYVETDLPKEYNYYLSYEPDWKSKVRTVLFDKSFKNFKPTSCKNWFKGCSALTTIIGMEENLNTSKVTDMSSMFYGCSKFENIDLHNLNTSTVTDMSDMFYQCSSLVSIDLRNVNTSSVVDMSGMFCNCEKLTNLDLSSFNTKNVIDMSSLFGGCSKLKVINITNFNTENVTNMSHMFSDCENLVSVDLRSFNTEYTTNMYAMFYNCSKLKTIFVSDKWIVDAVTSSDHMFGNCDKLYGGHGASHKELQVDDATYATIDYGASAPGYFTKAGDKPFVPVEAYAVLRDSTLTFYFAKNPPEGAYDVERFGWSQLYDVKKVVFDSSFKRYKPTRCSRWFEDFSNLTEIVGMAENFNTENVTDMFCMFDGCSNLKTLDLSNFNTSNVENMGYMFRGCSSLTNLDLSNFNTENVEQTQYMFSDCRRLRTICVSDKWSTDAVTFAENMFQGCNKLYGSKGSAYRVLGVSDETYAKIDEGTSKPGYFSKVGDKPFVPVEAYAVLKDSTLTFYYGKRKNENDLDVEIDLLEEDYVDEFDFLFGTWQSWKSGVKKVVFDDSFKKYKPTSCCTWFYGCENLTEIVGMKENLNTTNVTNMNHMFSNCKNLTDLDLSNFNTSNVTDMDYMFENCGKIANLDVSSFNTENLVYMSNMFAGCSGLTKLDLSSFNTQNVKYVKRTFSNCNNLTTIYVSDKWTDINMTNSYFFRENYTFFGCVNLYGGQGTIFDETRIDHLYAHVDGGEDNPGYLTLKGSNKPKVASIEVKQLPIKTQYYFGDNDFKLDEGEIRIRFSNGMEQTQKMIHTDVSGYAATTVGNQTVKVDYLGKSTTFDVNVIDSPSAYTLFDKTDSTLTLYYGNYREGAVWGISTVDSLRSLVKTVIIDPSYRDFTPKSTANMFNGYINMTEIIGIQNLNTSEVTNMDYMFSYCEHLSDVDLRNFNTENVTSMARMFYGTGLLNIDLSGFNTSNVVDMDYMFGSGYWIKNDSIREITNKVTTIYVGDQWNTDAITKEKRRCIMFEDCDELVGGMGTKFVDDWPEDANLSRAHIDGGDDNLGYFTLISEVIYIENAELPKKNRFIGQIAG